MKKILLVDDDMATLQGLQMCFGSKNFPTISATNVSAAKQLFDTEDISLVCTDWDLPGGKTGLDILTYARERNIPVVFLTGHDEDRWAVRVSDMFHCRLTFHCCQDFIHDGFFRIRKC